MYSETNFFTDFVEFLKVEKVLNTVEINDALSFVDGIEGVLQERTFILGYQGLAYSINSKLSLDDLKNFVSKHVTTLAQDADARYFFAQSLVDTSSLSEAERMTLIYLMPESYKPFLLKRFIES